MRAIAAHMGLIVRTVAAVVVKVASANVQMVDGRRRSISAPTAQNGFGGSSTAGRKEVTGKLKAEHRRQEDGTLSAGRMPTVAQFLDAWLASARQTVRPKTYVSYEGMVRLHVKPWIGKARLDKLTAVDVQGLVSGRAAKGQSTRVPAIPDASCPHRAEQSSSVGTGDSECSGLR